MTLGLTAASVVAGWFLAPVPSQPDYSAASEVQRRDSTEEVVATAGFDPIVNIEGILHLEAGSIRSRLEEMRGDHDEALAYLLFLRWIEIDPEGAVAYLFKTPDYREQIAGVYRSWTERDWRSAARSLKDDKGSRQESYSAFRGFVAGIPTEQAFAAFEWLQQNVVDQGKFQILLGKMAMADPEKAALMAIDHKVLSYWGSERSNQLALRYAFGGWLDSDRPHGEIIAWCDSLPLQKRSQSNRQLFRVWAKRDPLGALENLWSRVQSENIMDLTNSLWPSNLGQIEDCIEWVDQNVTSPSTAGRLIFRLLDPVDQLVDPGPAFAVLDRIDPALREGTREAVTMEVSRWATKDEAAALSWAASLEDGWLKDRATEALEGNR